MQERQSPKTPEQSPSNHFVTPTKPPIGQSALIKDFEPGDLLYGLERDRELYRPELEQKLTPHFEGSVLLTIDDIHSKLSKVIYNQHFQTTSPNTALLKAQKYESPMRSHLSTWILDENFTLIANSPTKILVQDDHDRINGVIRDGCLNALLNTKGTIRFCLDTFNTDDARLPNSTNYQSFTSIELRFAAENWMQINHHVVFYLHGEQCKAPWGTNDAQAWLENRSKAENVHLISSPPLMRLSPKALSPQPLSPPGIEDDELLMETLNATTPPTGFGLRPYNIGFRSNFFAKDMSTKTELRRRQRNTDSPVTPLNSEQRKLRKPARKKAKKLKFGPTTPSSATKINHK